MLRGVSWISLRLWSVRDLVSCGSPNRPRREPPGHAVDRITVLAQEIQELLDLVAL